LRVDSVDVYMKSLKQKIKEIIPFNYRHEIEDLTKLFKKETKKGGEKKCQNQ
jgi:hypothetical protein